MLEPERGPDRCQIESRVVAFLLHRRPDLGRTDLAPTTPLLEEDILTSLLLAELLTFLEQEFPVTIPCDDVSEENFATVRAIRRLVERHWRDGPPPGEP